MDKAEKAKQLLGGYFKMLAEKAGIRWDYENACEVEWIVDLIVEAAADKAILGQQAQGRN